MVDESLRASLFSSLQEKCVLFHMRTHPSRRVIRRPSAPQAGAYNARTSAVASINWQTLGMARASPCFPPFSLSLSSQPLSRTR